MKRLILTLIAGTLLVTALVFNTAAQTPTVKTLLSTYSLTSDTVSNTATAFLTAQSLTKGESTTIKFVATKISGTVAGTVTLLGSLDGTNYKALTVAEGTTALPTYTATDVASQNFIWQVLRSPYKYYRVSWTGSGTMSASFKAYLLSN
jgi:hypothetical protein